MDLQRPVNPDPRRNIPSVDRLRRKVEAQAPEIAGWAILEAVRVAVDGARGEAETVLAAGDSGAVERLARELAAIDWEARVLAHARRLAAPQPRRVINATGVAIHTNLGRAPLAAGAAEAAARAAVGYSNLELDLETGARGNRLAGLGDKLRILTGAEAGYACNNNAAAVLLALNSLAQGREVIVSRGELVEIGGSFRVPAILEKAGVRLVEVGTTNRTHPRDYAGAIGPETGLLLKVHRSNFEQRGFVAEVGLAELVAIGRERGVPVVEDLGSGSLVGLLRADGADVLPEEVDVAARVRTGADLVCFSGDKLVGGPQAGIVVGTADAVGKVRKNPLARALRLDKMTLAALDWTLTAVLEGRGGEIPVAGMLAAGSAECEARAKRLAARVEAMAPVGLSVEVEREPALVGGGSVPALELAGFAVALRGRPSPTRLQAALRASATPVVARVRHDALLLDPRCVGEDELPALEASLREALEQLSAGSGSPGEEH